MKKVRRILVVMDLPKQRQTALARAEQLARQFGAHLHLVAFVHHEMVEQKEVFDTHQRNEVRKALEHERHDWLLDRVRDAGLLAADLDIEVVWSKHIHEWITASCAEGAFDLVVKSAHRSRTLVHMPTDWHLLRDCPAPVWLVTAGHGMPRPAVLAAVDPTRRDRTHKALNRRVLDAAVACAANHDAEVHVGWCVTSPEVLGDLDIIDPRKYEKKMVQTMLPRLKEMVAEFGIPERNLHTPRGKPGTAMAGLAKQLRAELIVMGTAARRGVQGMVVGNTAERVLTEARCDLLTVRS